MKGKQEEGRTKERRRKQDEGGTGGSEGDGGWNDTRTREKNRNIRRPERKTGGNGRQEEERKASEANVEERAREGGCGWSDTGIRKIRNVGGGERKTRGKGSLEE